MTFTYDVDELTSGDVLTRIRMEIGDTISIRPLLQDEEIEQIISEKSVFYAQCAACCRLIAGRFAGKAQSVKLGDGFQETTTEIYNRYIEMAQRFEQRGQAPWSGSIDKMYKDTSKLDESTVKPNFKLGMMKNKRIF